MFRFIETIRVENGIASLLERHQRRMELTFEAFQKENSIDLKEVIHTLEVPSNGLFKWRLLYDLDGNFSSELLPYQVFKFKDFQLVSGDDVDYHFKYEDRMVLNQLKAQAEAQEIIIVKHGKITDTSFSNLLFKKGEHWFTPKSFLLNGVQRQYLLDEKKIREVEITLDNIAEFSHFQLINAMNRMNERTIYPIENIINLPR